MKGRTKDASEGPTVKRNAKPAEANGAAETKLSPSSKWHGKCIAELEWDSGKKKKTKKKSGRKYPDEVVKFVEGGPRQGQTEFQASRKCAGNVRRRTPMYNMQVRFLEHKFVQCNILAGNEGAEVSLPDEIKPLVINVTFLLHELKQRSDSKRAEELCGVITRITTLLMELSRRPIKKVEGDSPKPFDELSWKLADILREHNGPDDERYEKLVKDIECLEQELVQKEAEVNYVREQILEERERLMPSATDLRDCLRNSILKNQSLRAEIKFNKAQFRQYARALSEREQVYQKSLLELNNLRRKCARLEQSIESGTKPAYLRLSNTESDVLHGGSVTKYIKSKVVKEGTKQKAVKSKGRLVRKQTKK